MTTMLAAVSFTVAFVICCVGWGTILDGNRRDRPYGLDPGPLGLAALVAIGGVLNLAHAVRADVIGGLLAIGGTAAVWRLLRSSNRPVLEYLRSIKRTRWGVILLSVAGTAIVVRLFAAGVSRSFNHYDDFPAYFVFSTKMVETGWIGFDPFSSRRSLSALGGGYFLDAIVLCFFDHRSLNLMDKGVGLLLVAGSLLGFLRERRCPPALAAIPLTVLALVPVLRVNVTSLLLSSALFVALFRRFAAQSSAAMPLGEALRLGLMAAALCSLKSTMIPFAVIFPAVWFAQAFPVQPRAVLRSAAIFAGGAAALLLPWMALMRESAGTFLYPLLGRGNYGFPAVETISVYAMTAAIGVGLVPLLLVAPYRRLSHRLGDTPSFRWATVAALVAASVGTVGLVAGTSGMGYLRQPFPILFVLSLLVLATCLAGMPEETDPKWRRSLAIVAIVVCLAAFAGAVHRHRLYAIWQRDVAFGLSGLPLEPTSERERARRMQQAVPPGEPILAYVLRPYLFDFLRNAVFVADYPGAFAPPPGLPLEEGHEAVRSYLQAQGIRYVAVTPYPQLERDWPYPWLKLAVRHQLLFERRMVELARRCAAPFRDGESFVLDLGRCTSMDTGYRPDTPRRSRIALVPTTREPLR